MRRLVVLLCLALGLLARPARAHEGPPFPLLVDETVGPYVVSVWADPDIGTGTFFVILDPLSGRELAEVQGVRLTLTREDDPADVREVQAEVAESGGAAAQFEAQVEFPEQAWYEVRFIIQGAQGGGELLARVEATPPGYGRLGLLWFAAPFLLVGLLWFQVLARQRAARRAAGA